MTTAQFQILCTGNGSVQRQAETLAGLARNGALQKGLPSHPTMQKNPGNGAKWCKMVQSGAKSGVGLFKVSGSVFI